MTHKRLSALAVLVFAVLAWELVVYAGWISELALPRPTKVLADGIEALATRPFWAAWSWTIVEWLAAITLAASIGTAIGLVCAASEYLQSALMPLLSYLRALPPIAVFPVALIAIGPGKSPIVLVAATAAILYMVPGIVVSGQETSRRYRHLATVLAVTPLQWIVMFVAPSAFVHALASLRIGATLTFAVCIAGEMLIGGSHGVGASILLHSERYELERAYLLVVCCGLVGILIDWSVGLLASCGLAREGRSAVLS